jgi:parallel beta-helix repeat protein
MRKVIVLILLCSLSLLMAKKFTVSSSAGLHDAVNSDYTDLTINLKPGIYDLIPISVIDSTLGNAENPDSMIAVTTGLHLVGKNIKLIGEDRRKTIIRTHAGYGIFIEHCPQVLIKDLTITDGVRDQDGNATSGAIVVKHSETEITGCIIENNQGDFSQTIAGIIGIVGREDSNLNVHNNIIRDNSWDGIALYRKASAHIQDNLIFNGRGAGIGITWDAEALIVSHNVIHHYWKGIGTFGESVAKVQCNLVRDVRGWGIIASGKSNMLCWYNEVRRSGNVGIAQWDATANMTIIGNVINQSGQEKQWVAPLAGIWINAPDSLTFVSENLFWDNKQANLAFGFKEPGPDGTPFTFDHIDERFNNYAFMPAASLNETNYYKMSPEKLLLFSYNQLGTSIMAGIYSGHKDSKQWSWDPDKEPFKD